ncbi:Polyhomeotic-like protein 2 [Trichinella nelsoni]|uniref:Polyhomeotic-like protein 2 n=1 Tax=Trichinella nelsoni TaxID=6336 RepID=A0A0V0SB19_9BILA|nr:Polyhomeotic-like protein 2 [Trichinella nelsoni]
MCVRAIDVRFKDRFGCIRQLFRLVMEQNNFNAEDASQKENPSEETAQLVNLNSAIDNANPSDTNKDNCIVSSVMNSKGEALISEKSDEPVFNSANVADDATLSVEIRSLTTIHSCKTVEKTINEISSEKALPGSLKPTTVRNLHIRRRSLDEFFTTTQLRQFETMMGSREEPAMRLSKALEYNNNDGKQLMNNSLRKSPSLSEKAQNCPTLVASLNASSPTTVWKLNNVPSSVKRRKLQIPGNKLVVPIVSQAQSTSKRTLSESPPSKGIVINSSNFNFIHPKITQGPIFPQNIPTNRAHSTVFVNQCGTYSIVGLVPSTSSSNGNQKTSDNQVALLSPRKSFRVSDLSSKLPIAPRPAQFISPANNSSGFGLPGAVRATSHVTHPVFSSLCRSPIPGSNSSVFYPANLVLRSGQVISFKQPLRAAHPNLHPVNRRLPFNRPVVNRVNSESGYVTSSIVLASVSSNTHENQSSIAKAVTESESLKKNESSPTTSGNSHDLLIKNYVPLKPKEALRPFSDAQQNDSNRAASFLTSRDDRLWQIIDFVVKKNLAISQLNTVGGKNILRNGSGDKFSYHEFLSNPQMVADQFFHSKGHDAEIVEEETSLSEIKHVVYGYDILELYQYPKGYPEVSPYPQFLLDEVAKWRKIAKFHNRVMPVLSLNDESVKVEVENEEMVKNENVGKDLLNRQQIKGKKRKEEVDIKEKVENVKKKKLVESEEVDNINIMKHLAVKTSTSAVCDVKPNSQSPRVVCKTETQVQSPSSSTNSEQFIDSDPRKWTCEQVKAYVQTIFKEGEIDTSVFVNQAIDGIAFLLLNKDHLGELLALRLGPTVKLLAAIDKLRRFQH